MPVEKSSCNLHEKATSAASPYSKEKPGKKTAPRQPATATPVASGKHADDHHRRPASPPKAAPADHDDSRAASPSSPFNAHAGLPLLKTKGSHTPAELAMLDEIVTNNLEWSKPPRPLSPMGKHSVSSSSPTKNDAGSSGNDRVPSPTAKNRVPSPITMKDRTPSPTKDRAPSPTKNRTPSPSKLRAPQVPSILRGAPGSPSKICAPQSPATVPGPASSSSSSAKSPTTATGVKVPPRPSSPSKIPRPVATTKIGKAARPAEKMDETKLRKALANDEDVLDNAVRRPVGNQGEKSKEGKGKTVAERKN
ncbi:hypothetical protein AMAG_05824 [Allomyces macrogynus ATCC 38327]|uniref:Uncharacterized protein n=1 Tax=Allomyces macrogynus (strain ATCC 38327) TaxID=578462 RepID=A0A0L0SDF1_ALLM3|nr:hypothetical protein AMAG_05824 [Allomyces macrogynus ATCC 38327]|eukprot:KNE60435.1 hypothetical protein AMAG_05824 [Allomyces macrogynus ATCC 38327]